MMAFQKSTVIITGASRGIGRRIALGFARSTEHALFLIARDHSLLENTKQECINTGATFIDSAVCDITDPEQVQNLELPGQLPEAGVLINNAGNFLLKPLSETTSDEFMEQWKIHAFAPFLLTRKLLPGLVKQERGMIVNICSMSALKGNSRSGAYASSKHALLGYSRSLRLELTNTNVAVTAINLGQTMSTSWEGIAVDPSELIDPDDVASLIITLSRMSPRSVVEEINLKPQKGERSPD